MKQATQQAVATATPSHEQALAELKNLYESGKCGPLGLVAMSNQYPDVTITELTQIMREVKTGRANRP